MSQGEESVVSLILWYDTSGQVIRHVDEWVIRHVDESCTGRVDLYQISNHMSLMFEIDNIFIR